MKKEIWKPVVGYEGLYEVSSYGRVKSLVRVVCGKNGSFRKIPGKVLKPALLIPKGHKKGYLRVRLGNGQKQKVSKWYLVHILVYKTFIGPIPAGMQVNHINEDGTDNRLENLNLMTPKENNCWGTRIARAKSKQINSKCSKPVLAYNVDGSFLGYFPSCAEAGRNLNIKTAFITRVCRGERTHYKQYRFRFQS